MPRRPRPSLLAPGDKVRFEPVSAERFAELQAQVRAGAFASAAWLEAA